MRVWGQSGTFSGNDYFHQISDMKILHFDLSSWKAIIERSSMGVWDQFKTHFQRHFWFCTLSRHVWKPYFQVCWRDPIWVFALIKITNEMMTQTTAYHASVKRWQISEKNRIINFLSVRYILFQGLQQYLFISAPQQGSEVLEPHCCTFVSQFWYMTPSVMALLCAGFPHSPCLSAPSRRQKGALCSAWCL